MKRLGQLGGQFGLLLQGLLPGEVENVLLGDVIVDDRHTVVVTNEGSHSLQGDTLAFWSGDTVPITCGRPLDGVGVVSLGPSLQQQGADVGLAGQASEVEAGIVVLVVTSVWICSLLQQILGYVLLTFPRGVHQRSHPGPVLDLQRHSLDLQVVPHSLHITVSNCLEDWVIMDSHVLINLVTISRIFYHYELRFTLKIEDSISSVIRPSSIKSRAMNKIMFMFSFIIVSNIDNQWVLE